MDGTTHVVLCRCRHGQGRQTDVRQLIEAKLTGFDRQAMTVVDDLCRLAAMEPSVLRQMAQQGPLLILACFDRAVRGLFAAAEAPLDMHTTTFVNFRRDDPAEIRRRLEPLRLAPVPGFDGAEGITADDAWTAWFPVIDPERCHQCQQCLNFCLFGVYGLDDQDRVTVARPQQCKPNCPACARVCPQQAIMFPRHESDPIAGATATSAPGAPDLADLVQNDVYALLRRRSQDSHVPFDPERDEATARQERLRCLRAWAQSQTATPTAGATPAAADPTPGRTCLTCSCQGLAPCLCHDGDLTHCIAGHCDCDCTGHSNSA